MKELHESANNPKLNCRTNMNMMFLKMNLNLEYNKLSNNQDISKQFIGGERNDC